MDFRCFLKFVWGDSLYQFKVLPNGLSSGPHMFTKILKPIYAHLRQQGHIVSGYIDDSLLMSQTFDQCNDNVRMTDELFTSLGFSINYAKSATTPSQQLEHLGFLLDSANMAVSLTQNKREKLKNKCRHILNASSSSSFVRQLSYFQAGRCQPDPGVLVQVGQAPLSIPWPMHCAVVHDVLHRLVWRTTFAFRGVF